MTFGAKLKEIRLSRNLSQEDFAKILDTSKQVISRYELEQTTPKISVVAKWCKILNISLDVMIDDDLTLADAPLSGLAHTPTPQLTLTPHETDLVITYREHPEMQPAVDKILGIDEKP